MLTFWRHAIQSVYIFLVRPYIIRDLPGWGKLALINYKWDWFWVNAPVKTFREKRSGYLITLDLTTWPDRFHYFVGYWYEVRMLLLISDLVVSGETIVDVGANRGDFGLAATLVVGSGKVICFEPNPNCARRLEDVIKLNQIHNITLHQYGLADVDDILTLTVPLHNSGEGSFAESQFKDNLTYSVPVRRGDDVLAHETPSLIKIDVEGFETNVIVGLFETIKRCSPVVITEVIGNHLNRAGSSVDKLTSAMERLGYKGFRLESRQSDRGHDWCLAEFDPSPSADCDVIWLNASVEKHRLISGQRFDADPRKPENRPTRYYRWLRGR